MLFKNDKLIDLKGDSPEAKDYQAKKKEIQENIGFPVVFTVNQSYVSKQEKGDGSYEYYMPHISLPNISSVSTPDGREEWRWSPVMPREKNGSVQFPRGYTNTWYTEKVLKLNEGEMDKIYFLLYKCPQFKYYYSLDDAKLKASKNVEDKIRAAKIQGVFYGENSVLLKDDDKLRKIARAWNIANVEKLSRDQVLEHLEKTVMDQDAREIRSIDDFIEATELGYHVEVGALVQKAEDLGLIHFDSRTLCWFYKNLDGSLGDKLVLIPKGNVDAKYEELVEFIFAEKEHIARIKSLVNANDVPKSSQLNMADLEHEPWDKVKEYCNRVGIAATGRGRNKEVVFDDIRRHASGE